MTRLAETMAASAALLLGLLVRPDDASAYCQTTLCGNGLSGVRCSPAQSGDCGTPLRWPQRCIGYSLHEGASSRVDYATLAPVVAKAFAAWTHATCAGTPAGIAAFDLGPVACNQKEYNLEGGNANVVFFHDDKWPYAGAGNTLALTTVTFNLDDASILDADLEVNGTVDLTVVDEGAQFDLQSILTHEAGHMLGLAHSAETQATMYIQYGAGDTSLRNLHPDDAEGICKTYPPADVSGCDPTPRRGLESVCDAPQRVDDAEGCACRAGTAPLANSGASAEFALAGLSLACAARRRRIHPRAGVARG
ncbi:MAG: matrixin family metalloprotease [Deltaproteobacteria bacterium]|nr:matrixin family metalloprotease [Deltaproteobacteria bacterium]